MSLLQQPWDFHIRDAVEGVTFTLATELDPEEKHWPNYASLAPLREELYEILQAAIADWLLTKEQEAKALQHEQNFSEAAYVLEDAAYDQARDEAMRVTGVDEEYEAMRADLP